MLTALLGFFVLFVVLVGIALHISSSMREILDPNSQASTVKRTTITKHETTLSVATIRHYLWNFGCQLASVSRLRRQWRGHECSCRHTVERRIRREHPLANAAARTRAFLSCRLGESDLSDDCHSPWQSRIEGRVKRRHWFGRGSAAASVASPRARPRQRKGDLGKGRP